MEVLNKKDHATIGGSTPWACGVTCGAACLIHAVGAVFGHIIVSY